ncbi:MAG: hypothetical protein HRT47_05510 [Candidatus Caenarcaniphilales bacterium]|nr:hypothetical protein [Candidatus Caenarcaniphilales bacterium]
MTSIHQNPNDNSLVRETLIKLSDRAALFKKLKEKKSREVSKQEQNKKLHKSPLEEFLSPEKKPTIYVNAKSFRHMMAFEVAETIVKQLLYNNYTPTMIKLVIENAQNEEKVHRVLKYIHHLMNVT